MMSPCHLSRRSNSDLKHVQCGSLRSVTWILSFQRQQILLSSDWDIFNLKDGVNKGMSHRIISNMSGHLFRWNQTVKINWNHFWSPEWVTGSTKSWTSAAEIMSPGGKQSVGSDLARLFTENVICRWKWLLLVLPHPPVMVYANRKSAEMEKNKLFDEKYHTL